MASWGKSWSKAQAACPRPEHAGSRVRFDGQYGKPGHRRQLYRCVARFGIGPQPARTLARPSFTAETTALDMGYDNNRVYAECEDRDSRPIIPLRETPGVKRGDHRPPECEHGTWAFAGSDPSRGRSKWRCPTGECKPGSRWIKADRLRPLVPRETKRWKSLYRGRASVEREFGRLKHEWALLPLRVRGIERVRLHADLTILAKLACALARGAPLAAGP
jgi:hypothetical protein